VSASKEFFLSVKKILTATFCKKSSGLVPGEDAPDIIANTFLQTITPEQIERVGKGFLCHRECKLSFIYVFLLN
jgi:hypothetical protein